MRGAWEFIIRNDERNPLTNVPRALDVTFNKLWKGLERVFKVSSFQKKTRRFCRGFEKLGDFCFPPPQPDTAQSPVATAPGQRTMWTTSYGRVFVYTYVYIYIFKISANTRTYLLTYVHESWNCYQYLWATIFEGVGIMSIMSTLSKGSKNQTVFVRCLFGDCFLPAWAAQRRWQGQWHSCSLGHSKCNGIFCVRLVFDLSFGPVSRKQMTAVHIKQWHCLSLDSKIFRVSWTFLQRCETSVDVDVLGAITERCQWLYGCIMGMLVTRTAVFQSRNIWVPCHSRTRHTGRLVSHLIRFYVLRKRTTRTSELHWISLNGWAPNCIAWRLARPEI